MVLNNFEKILFHKTVVVPDHVNLFILGDIHGQLDNLYTVLGEAGFHFGVDFLFCCGDLIDRGTQNREVVTAFEEESNWYTVLGNHDLFPITDEFNLWTLNGGAWALKDRTIFHENNKYNVEHTFFNQLIQHPVLITVIHRGKKYGIVHAGIPYRGIIADFIDNDWDRMVPALNTFGTQALEYFVWDRNSISDILRKKTLPDIKNVDLVFSGHTVIDDPIQHGNRVYLDIGSVHYKKYAIFQSTTNSVEVYKI